MERFDIREGLNLVFDDINPKDGGTTTLELSVRRNVNETNGISWIVGHYRNYRNNVFSALVGHFVPSGHKKLSPTLGQGTFSYIGNDATCQDVIDEFRKAANFKKSILILPQHFIPISGVNKKVLSTIVDRLHKKDAPPFLSTAIIGLATNGRFDLSPSIIDIVENMSKDIKKGTVNLFPKTENVGGQSHQFVLATTRQDTFVVADNGTPTIAHYVLGGVDQIRYKKYLATIKKQPKNLRGEHGEFDCPGR